MSGTGDLVTRAYGGLRGVDFRGEEVNLMRSPDSLNVWKDYKEIDSIRTRPGLEKKYAGREINNFAVMTVDGEDVLIVHEGTKLECFANWQEEEGYSQCSLLYTEMENSESRFFIFNGELYILNGGKYLVTDGERQAAPVEGYIPTTSISRKPEGGGTIHEDVNLLTGWRKNTFLGDGKSTLYCLDTRELDEDEEIIVSVLLYNGDTGMYEDTVIPQYVYNDDGVASNVNYTFSRRYGEVRFAAFVPPPPATDGQDNVTITFKKTVEGNRETVTGCTIVTVFDNRVFLSGNPEHPNYIFHGSLNDPTYFSDLDYYREGSETAAVKRMVAGNNALWVFREPSMEGETIFYHNPATDDEYGKVYPSTHSNVSLGCVGEAANFNDDIVFFSERGMEGISGDVTTEQVIAHRSTLVDRKLLAEKEYKQMVLAEWEGYLLVFVGNHVYLADSRAVFTNESHIEYEWFYWEWDVQIDKAFTYNGVLYLGTDKGIYTVTNRECAVECWWTTPKDKFNHPQMQKTTNKRGCVVEATGDVTVYAKTENTDFELIGTYENVKDYFVSRIKRKKFKDIQLKFHSNTRFSLETVTLECWIGGYIKR